MSKFGLQIPQKQKTEKPKSQFQLQLASAQKKLFNVSDEDSETQKLDFTKPSTAKEAKIVSNALEEDASIFDYDAHYVPQQTRAKPTGDGKPKYMEALIASAQARKVEQARIQERKIQKQREEEGDLGGEKFVTSAYKQHLEQTRHQETKEKEESRDMTSFYRNVLDTMSTRTAPEETAEQTGHAAGQTGGQLGQTVGSKYGLNVPHSKFAQVNDDGQIVDKRALLTAGLNVSKAPSKPTAQAPLHQKPVKRRHDSRMDSKMLQDLEKQHFEKLKRDEEERRREKEHIVAKVTKKADSETISDAKRRYLERKKAKEAG